MEMQELYYAAVYKHSPFIKTDVVAKVQVELSRVIRWIRLKGRHSAAQGHLLFLLPPSLRSYSARVVCSLIVCLPIHGPSVVADKALIKGEDKLNSAAVGGRGGNKTGPRPCKRTMCLLFFKNVTVDLLKGQCVKSGLISEFYIGKGFTYCPIKCNAPLTFLMWAR